MHLPRLLLTLLATALLAACGGEAHQASLAGRAMPMSNQPAAEALTGFAQSTHPAAALTGFAEPVGEQ